MALSALEQTQLAVVAFVKLPQTGGRIAGNAFGVASARCVLRGIDVDDGIRAPPRRNRPRTAGKIRRTAPLPPKTPARSTPTT